MNLKLVCVVVATMVAGCVAPAPEIVDLEGKDPVQANRDMAWCQVNAPAFSLGSSTAKCMRDKGYTMLGVYAGYNKPKPDTSKVVVVPQ